MQSSDSKITVRAPTNIALIKYWGKKDPVQNIPLNSSLSLSVNISQFYSQTTVSFSSDNSTSMILNNKPSTITKRINSVITAIKALANPELSDKGIFIETFNNFPTAAGMASSASGLAALTFALSKLFNLQVGYEELSCIARLGSGSASRSLFGGIVEWKTADTHNESNAFQVLPASHWPELRLLVIITCSKSKEVPSTDAMLIQTEQLLRRANEIVPSRLEAMKLALTNKDFESVANIMMTDSDCLHSCINATGVNYLNNISDHIKELVRNFNSQGTRVAYTFDAGPNAWILTQSKDVNDFIRFLIQSLKVEQSKIQASVDLTDFETLQQTASMEIESIVETSVSETGPILL